MGKASHPPNDKDNPQAALTEMGSGRRELGRRLMMENLVDLAGGLWRSRCCGAPPHMATPDIGPDNQAGICANCREHTGFELAVG